MSQTHGDPNKIYMWPREATQMNSTSWKRICQSPHYDFMPSPSQCVYPATHVRCAATVDEMVLRFE